LKTSTTANLAALILAGGKGTRLKPYTTFVPKPLMPIGDLPIIEVVLKQLKHAGISDVTLAVGHLAQLIQSFVGDGTQLGLDIAYSREEQELGTAGPIGLLRSKLIETDAFLTMNGDILTTLNYRRAIDFHFANKATATICVNRRTVAIDFGVIETDDAGRMTGYIEKPVIDYSVSMGINIFSPRVLNFIPQDKFFTIPDLMLSLRAANEPVFCFSEDAYWLDIGRVEDYQTACEVFEARRLEFLPNG
jgi:NDP-sugar pyrophosphorylase family protein